MFAFLGGLSEPRSVCIEKRYLPSFVVDPPHWHERACCGWHLPHTHMKISYFAGYTYYTAKHDCISACVLCISPTICCGVGEVAYFRFRHGSHDVGGLFRFSILLVNISPVAACILPPLVAVLCVCRVVCQNESLSVVCIIIPAEIGAE